MSAPAPTARRPRLDASVALRPAARLLDRPLADYHLVLGSTALLLVLGLVMVLSASSVTAYADSGSSFSVVEKQLLWVAVGVPVMIAASRLPAPFWRRMAYPAMVLAVLLLGLLLVPGVGRSVNGNTNWIDFGGPFRIQPSEAAKFALILWGADLLARKQRLLDQWRHLLVPLLPASMVVLGLVLIGGDLGTGLVVMAITAVLLLVVGAPLRLFAALGLGALGLIAAMSVTAPHRIARFQYWLHPEDDPLGAGWQALHGKYALASGGWWGLGLGASREKWGALPEAHTDFIFAVVGEELGLIGTLAVLALFAALITGGLRIALRARDPFTRYAAAGVTGWIAFQALVNLGAVLGVLPITGVPLPLLSYGGSALLPLLAAIGMLLAFARAEPAAAALLARRSAQRSSQPARRSGRTSGGASGGASGRTGQGRSSSARGARPTRP